MLRPDPERRFAVQRVVGRGWRTVSVHPGRAPAAERFAACVRAEPRAVHRLIEAEAGDAGRFEEFDWRLLELHDPRRLGLSPDLSEPAPPAAGTPPSAPARREGARMPAPSPERLPLRLYLAVVLAGMVLGTVTWFLLRGWPLPG